MHSASSVNIRDKGALDLVQFLLLHGTSVRIMVTGCSMQPLLKGGELLELHPFFANEQPRPGDILFFLDQGGNPLVHRLIWRRSHSGGLLLLTKGDACAAFDGFVPLEQTLGRARRIIVAGGQTIDLQHPFRRLQASFLVARTLFLHALHKAACHRNQRTTQDCKEKTR